ncbi:hypothetical protein K438DRAFT_1992893 [Mycena galopus ATCC 62051]|nr:hypothetical protein K438DRAFT_1992893 [Mycena galopus ATCC 62051]
MLSKHVLEPSDIILTDGGYVLHSDLAGPLNEVIPAMIQMLRIYIFSLNWIDIINELYVAMTDFKSLHYGYSSFGTGERPSRMPRILSSLPPALRAKLPKNFLHLYGFSTSPAQPADLPERSPSTRARTMSNASRAETPVASEVEKRAPVSVERRDCQLSMKALAANIEIALVVKQKLLRRLGGLCRLIWSLLPTVMLLSLLPQSLSKDWMRQRAWQTADSCHKYSQRAALASARRLLEIRSGPACVDPICSNTIEDGGRRTPCTVDGESETAKLSVDDTDLKLLSLEGFACAFKPVLPTHSAVTPTPSPGLVFPSQMAWRAAETHRERWQTAALSEGHAYSCPATQQRDLSALEFQSSLGPVVELGGPGKPSSALDHGNGMRKKDADIINGSMVDLGGLGKTSYQGLRSVSTKSRTLAKLAGISPQVLEHTLLTSPSLIPHSHWVLSWVTAYLDFLLVSTFLRNFGYSYFERFRVGAAAPSLIWEREGIGTRAWSYYLDAGVREHI